MSSLAISFVVFGCIFGGALLGILLRSRLPEHHLSDESRDLVKLGMGLIGTMTALVLGLLIASAKSSFDTQRNGLAQMSGKIILLDRILAQYGPETKEVRAMIRDGVADTIRKTWPSEEAGAGTTPEGTEGRYEVVMKRIQALTPTDEAQRTLKAQALATAIDVAQTRWLLFSQKGSSVPPAFLVVMVAWLSLILASFSLFAPRNGMALVTLFICAAAVSSAVFLILELDQPFQGIMRVPSAPLRNALEQLGHD
jgi:hypothetical protein